MFEYAAMNEFSAAWILVYVYEAFLIVWVLHPATGALRNRKGQITSAAFAVLYVVMKLFLENYVFWNMAGMILLVSIYLLILSDMPRLNALWCAAVFASCIELGRLLVYGSIYVGGAAAFYQRYQWLLRLLTQILKTALVLFCRGQIRDYLEEKVGSVDFVLTGIAVFELIFMHMQRLARAAEGIPAHVPGLGIGGAEVLSGRFFETASFLMLGLGVFAILLAVCSHVRIRGQERYVVRLREASRINYEQMQMKMEMDQEVRRMYHDLKHQLTAMNLPEVSEQLLKNSGYAQMVTSGNPLLDALLHQKTERARQQDTALDLFVEQNEYAFIESMDLCSVFGNALDNALEACAKLPDREDRWIRVKSAVIGGVWILKVENSCEKMPDSHEGEFRTTKKDAANHGIGLRSIRYCAEKYGGRMDIHAEDRQFTLTVTMPVITGNESLIP